MVNRNLIREFDITEEEEQAAIGVASPDEMEMEWLGGEDVSANQIVEGKVLIEIKTCKAFDEAHAAQCLNYLQTTGLPCCLLINFGPSVQVKRFRNFKSKSSL